MCRGGSICAMITQEVITETFFNCSHYFLLGIGKTFRPSCRQDMMLSEASTADSDSSRKWCQTNWIAHQSYKKSLQSKGSRYIVTVRGNTLKQGNDILYLGSWITACSKDTGIRIGKSWEVLQKIAIVEKSSLPSEIKVEFFRTTVGTFLLYDFSA